MKHIMTVALMACVAVCVVPGLAVAADLLTNGDMEIDAGWQDWGVPAVNALSTDYVHGGTYSRKVQSNTAGVGVRAVSFTVSDGAIFNISLWIYSIDGHALTVSAKDGDWVQLILDNITPPVGVWTEYTYSNVTISPTGGGSQATLGVYLNGAGTSTWYMDDAAWLEAAIAPSGSEIILK